jgi:hypothetical protein
MGCGAELVGERDASRPDTAASRPPVPSHLAGRILAERGRLEGERKQVTVLFADMAGSTELIRDLDAEDAQRLLDGALGAMIEAVHRFDGTVTQTRGDGLLGPARGAAGPGGPRGAGLLRGSGDAGGGGAVCRGFAADAGGGPADPGGAELRRGGSPLDRE